MSKSILTESRRAWLRYLAAHGETEWNRMPRRKQVSNRPVAALTNRTWRPMQVNGLIEARYYAPSPLKQTAWYFKITDAGVAALDALGEKT